MQEKVRIGGATIPRSWYFMISNPELANLVLDESTTESEEESSSENIGDVVERWLNEKTRRSLNRHETLAPSSHQWRRNERAGASGKRHRSLYDPTWIVWLSRGKGVYTKHTLSPRKESLDAEESAVGLPEKKDLGTNQILEKYCRLHNDSERTNFLITLMKGDCTKREYDECVNAADRVRVAYHIGRFYGIDKYVGTLQGEDIFKAILKCINTARTPSDLQKSVQLTDLVVDTFGLESMPAITWFYSPILKLKALVPKEHLQNIVSIMGELSLKGPALMRKLGYEAVKVEGIPVLYYNPSMKPI